VKAGIDADHLFPLKSRTHEAYGTPDALMDGEYRSPSTTRRAMRP
jgi:hypothetical protein